MRANGRKQIHTKIDIEPIKNVSDHQGRNAMPFGIIPQSCSDIPHDQLFCWRSRQRVGQGGLLFLRSRKKYCVYLDAE